MAASSSRSGIYEAKFGMNLGAAVILAPYRGAWLGLGPRSSERWQMASVAAAAALRANWSSGDQFALGGCRATV